MDEYWYSYWEKLVNKLFPNSKPSKDLNERNEVIRSWNHGDESIEVLLGSLDNQFMNFSIKLTVLK